MGLQWFLLIACALCCINRGLYAESLEEQNPEASDDANSFAMSSLFGFRPCFDEGCISHLIRSAEYHVQRGYAVDNLHGQDYEPQIPDVVSPSPDAVVEYCLPLHTSTVHEVTIIDMRHPDIKDVKLKVIEDLVRYAFQISVLDAENCHPAMKLLDYIIIAAEMLKQDYAKECGNICNYTKIIDDRKLGKYPKRGEDKVEVTSTSASVKDLSSTSPGYVSTEASTKLPCPVGDEPSGTSQQVETTVNPCPEKPSQGIEPTEEIIAEDDGQDYPSPPYVGSVRGIPGVHYPNYTDVPITSFSCADKKYIPGFYADLETGCQVFHVCYEHRRESLLCPVGTIFNQPILACDYWYSSNCSLAPVYYEVNAKAEEDTDVAVEELITVLVEHKKETDEKIVHGESKDEKEVDIMKFLPVKAKVTEFRKHEVKEEAVSSPIPEVSEVEQVASQIFKMVSSVTHVVPKSPAVIERIPEPKPVFKYEVKPAEAKLAKAKLAAAVPIAKVASVKTIVPLVAKAKLAAVAAAVPAAKFAAVKTAVPVAAKGKLAAVAAAIVPAAKVAALKTAVPTAAKVKLAATVPIKKVAVPILAKAKLAATVPKVAAKVSIPVLKTKMIASALPLAKSKMVSPVLKGKALKAASAPLVKAKLAALPLVKGTLIGAAPVVKAKLAKVATISPLTKKALALGYMKLLKAKKLALKGRLV